jgi:hypothetical protein
MRHLVALAAVIASCSLTEGAQSATTADLGFMAGCWRLSANGRTIDEHWLPPAGGSLMGVSRTVANGKTVEYEFLQIRDLPEGLTYIARPSGQTEAQFKISSKTADEIVFENPTHDFPQRIRYKRVGADRLEARIEGTMNGKSRGIDFPYARVACTP